MTRPVHWHNVPWASRTACGRMIARVLSSTIERDVTAPCCLKLIAQQPSGAATARASAVKPVERSATVAATDSVVSISEMFPEATARAYQSSRLARLENLLREVVEADQAVTDAYAAIAIEESENGDISEGAMVILATAQDSMIAAIEAARREVKP